jgi:hypothetical protein
MLQMCGIREEGTIYNAGPEEMHQTVCRLERLLKRSSGLIYEIPLEISKSAAHDATRRDRHCIEQCGMDTLGVVWRTGKLMEEVG